MDSVKDWWGEREMDALHAKQRSKATPAPTGSGPEGETCKTCAFRYKRSGGARSFYKCRWVKPTSGAGTDISLKWAACRKWQEDRDLPMLEEMLREFKGYGTQWAWIPSGFPIAISVSAALSPWTNGSSREFHGATPCQVENAAVAWLRSIRRRSLDRSGDEGQ